MKRTLLLILLTLASTGASHAVVQCVFTDIHGRISTKSQHNDGTYPVTWNVLDQTRAEVYYGISHCSIGLLSGAQGKDGDECICKLTYPTPSNWVLYGLTGDFRACTSDCPAYCAEMFADNPTIFFEELINKINN